MADMISRAYALAIIENQLLMKEPEDGEPLIMEAYKSGFRDAMEQIRLDLMTVPVREKWTPVTEKKPNDGDYILGSWEDLVDMVHYYSDDDWHKQMKAWMPIPLPYIEPKKRRRKQK